MKHLIEDISNYVRYGYPQGSFMQAVLCNDLKLACMHADYRNQSLLFDIVNFLYNNIPADAWGSPEKYSQWITAKQEERDQ